MRDFTLQSYEMLCRTISDLNIRVVPFYKYIEEPSSESFIVLRHDVDKFPWMAYQMAQLENQYGLQATYYFRNTRAIFKPDIIRKINGLGHEIGYHYETMSQSNGDVDRAMEMFLNSLQEFRKICSVKTVCMHGSSFSKWDNRELWKYHDFKDYGVIGEPYLSVNYDQIDYVSDSGGSWSNNGQRIRDVVPQMLHLSSTMELINLLKEGKASRMIILTHPDRWHSNPVLWGVERVMCKVRNTIKKIVLR